MKCSGVPTTLWNKNYLALLAGYGFYWLGNGLFMFALPLYILMETDDPTLLGTILALSAIPMVLLSPVGGIIADRFSKQKLMMLMHLLGTVGFAVYFAFIGQVNMIVGSVVLLLFGYTLDGLFASSIEASIPAIIPEEQIVRGNSISTLVTSLAQIVTPVVGGFILIYLGLATIMSLAIILSFSALVCKAFCRVPFTPQHAETTLAKTIVTDLRTASFFVSKENRAVGKALILLALLNISLGNIVSVALPVLMTVYFDQGEQTLGVVQGFIMVSAIVASLLSAKLGDKLSIQLVPKFLLTAAGLLALLGGVFLVASYTALPYLLTIGVFFLIMMLHTLVMIALWSYIGEHTPEHLLGKVMGLAFSFMIAGIGIGSYFYGLSLGWFIDTPAVALLIFATVAGIVGLFARVR